MTMRTIMKTPAITALTMTSIFISSAASAAVPSPPKPPVPSPVAVDVAMPYVGQSICDPVARPGVVDFAETISRVYGRRWYHTFRTCQSDVSEHYDGRALDWAILAADPAQKEIADGITAWLTKPVNGIYGANARRLGIMYIIWNGKVWRSYRDSNKWLTYTGAVPHIDHIHFSFGWDGACKRTSWWTGKTLTSVSNTMCTMTGVVDPPTNTLPPLVAMDTEFTKHKTTILSLGSYGSAVKLAQANVKTTADGVFGPKTQTAVKYFQYVQGLYQTSKVDRPTWDRMEKLKYPLINYRSTTILRRGSTGTAVKAAQNAMRISADGQFGPMTEAAVKAVQKKYQLTQDGTIQKLTWAALDQELRSRMIPAP